VGEGSKSDGHAQRNSSRFSEWARSFAPERTSLFKGQYGGMDHYLRNPGRFFLQIDDRRQS